ncbi:hypothetical protein C2L66_00775 [Paraburkholderia caribensis]|nr:hypothetical protein C2L66_00775 [Paraburkholderia caribensis]
MPVRPAPFTLKCNQCGWKHTFAPRSDVMTPDMDSRSHCPRCGAHTLVRLQPNLIEWISGGFSQIWWGR